MIGSAHAEPVAAAGHARDARPVAVRPRALTGRRVVAVLALAAVAAAAARAGVGREDLVNEAGWDVLSRFLGSALRPRLDGAFLALVADAALTTLAYAALGTALSVALGLVGGVLSSELWWRRGRRGAPAATLGWLGARAGLALPRGIHEVLWGLLLLSVFGLDPIVAVLAIGIPYGAVTAKVFSEILDEAPHGPYDALRAAGAGRLAALAFGLLPPAAGDMLSYAFYRFECAIRAAAILGLIGAGGLGFQIALSFQSLRFDELWTLVFALVLLSGAVDAWSATVRRRRGRDRVIVASLLLAPALLVASALWIRLDPAAVVSERARTLLGEIAGTAFPPDFSRLGTMAAASLDTLAMSVLAAALSAAGAVLIAFPAARARPGAHRSAAGRIRVVVLRLALLLFRAIPPPVWALLLLFVLYPGIVPGALALAAYNLGVLGRLMAEAAENLDDRPAAALRAAGASDLRAFAYAGLPQAAPRFAAYGLYRWEVVMRETVVVGVVGAGGLGVILHDRLVAFDYASATAAVLVLVALTLLVDVTSAAVRRTLR